MAVDTSTTDIMVERHTVWVVDTMAGIKTVTAALIAEHHTEPTITTTISTITNSTAAFRRSRHRVLQEVTLLPKEVTLVTQIMHPVTLVMQQHSIITLLLDIMLEAE